jgi:multiple sugar transport system permease protein
MGLSVTSFKQKLEWASSREAMEAYFLILVPVFLSLLFGYFSMIFAFVLSFFEWDYLTPAVFVGFENYTKILEDLIEGLGGAIFYDVPFFVGLRNILFYTALVIPIQTGLAIILATLANQKLRGTTFFKLAYFLPATTSAVIISLLFVWLFRQQGFINYSMSFIIPGFQPNWLHEADFVIPAMALVAIWGTSGHFTISFLAALQSIPEDLYEAASLDGAGRLSQFRHITLPMLRPMTFYVIVMGLIGAIQMFDLAFVMGTSAPQGMGLTPTLDIYTDAFERRRVGLAAAKSFVLFIIVFFFTYIVRRRSEVNQ